MNCSQQKSQLYPHALIPRWWQVGGESPKLEEEDQHCERDGHCRFAIFPDRALLHHSQILFSYVDRLMIKHCRHEINLDCIEIIIALHLYDIYSVIINIDSMIQYDG